MALPLREFVSWLPVCAMLIMALNDHVLKAHFHSWWTGKLSDFAGLIYFPLLLTAGVNTFRVGVGWIDARVRRRAQPAPAIRLQHWQLVLAIVLTGGIFFAINLSPAGMARFVTFLNLFHRAGVVRPSTGVSDPTDLLALPALGISYLWGRRFLTEDGAGPLTGTATDPLTGKSTRQ